MATGQRYVNFTPKRLLGYKPWKEKFLEYLRGQFTDLYGRVYTKGVTYGASKVAIVGSGADEFDLSPNGSQGTDGAGHLCITAADYENNVQFENTSAIDYHIGLHFALRPKGVQPNARTSKPEYQDMLETIGEEGEPNSVAAASGKVQAVVTSVTEDGVSNAGRKCLIWKITPADAALSEAIAIEECVVQWGDLGSGNVNYIETTTDALGQSTIDTDETHYRVCLLGPTVRRNTDLSTVSGYWYIGTVTGAGAGNPPTVFDNSGQVNVEKSLSDILLNLVYDNVINTFTRRQNFMPSVDELAAYFARDMDDKLVEMVNPNAGPNNTVLRIASGRKAARLESDYAGTDQLFVLDVFWQGSSPDPAYGAAISGAVDPGAPSNQWTAGVRGSNSNGIGLMAEGRYNSPARGAAKHSPQQTRPSAPSDGELWVTASTPEAGCAVGGDARVYAESKKTRRLLYPLSFGQPYTYDTGMHWYWDYTGWYWVSDNTVNPEYITFALNKMVPQGCIITSIRVRIFNGAARILLADRPRAALWQRDEDGTTPWELARNYTGGTAATFYDVELLPYGTHTGGSGAATLTDGTKNWVPDALVGQTVYNLTDGSTGTITANTANTITATLTGGTDNDWDTGDVYQVAGATIKMSTPIESDVQYYLLVQSGNDNQIDRIHTIDISYLEGDYLAIP